MKPSAMSLGRVQQSHKFGSDYSDYAMAGTIVLIEDNKSILEGIRAALSLVGYEVHDTVSVREGKDLIRETKPDILILDYLLSGCNAFDVLDWCNEQDDVGAIPTLVISAHPSAAELVKERAEKLSFLAKPFSLQVLRSMVEELMDDGSRHP